MSMRRGGTLVVSVHDVAPVTRDASMAWVKALDRRGIPGSLLVVPGPWQGVGLLEDPVLVSWLRDAVRSGHEIAQHGWIHGAGPEASPLRRAAGSVLARGCAEFWALEEQEARARLHRGRAVLWRANLDPIGFTPPGWLASPGTRHALRSLGYRYGTDHAGVYDLVARRRHLAPALSSRPGGAAEWIGRKTMIAGARHLSSLGGIVRVALHPADWHDPCLRTAALLAIDAALDAGATPCTYAELVKARAATTIVLRPVG
jgi:predicted deacetylase